MTKTQLMDFYNKSLTDLLIKEYGSTDGKFIDTKFGQLKVSGDIYCGDIYCKGFAGKYIGLHTCFWDKDFKKQPYYKELIATIKDVNPYSGKWNHYWEYPKTKNDVLDLIQSIRIMLDEIVLEIK